MPTRGRSCAPILRKRVSPLELHRKYPAMLELPDDLHRAIMREQLAPHRAQETEWERQMLRTEVKHYIDTSGLAYSYNEFYTQNMPDKVAWKTLQSNLFANLPQIKKRNVCRRLFRSFAEVVEKTSGMGCRAYKAPALSRRRKVAHHAGKKESLVGLAAAAACCMVGGAGGGLPLAAGHEDNGSAGCAEQRTGRAVS